MIIQGRRTLFDSIILNIIVRDKLAQQWTGHGHHHTVCLEMVGHRIAVLVYSLQLFERMDQNDCHT